MPEVRTLPRSAMNILPVKERMKILRRHMLELDPEVRSRNFEEVNLGLPTEDALIESSRCIECAKPGCIIDCPVGVKIKEVIALIRTNDFLGAAAKLREDNSLPAITGRVCPQENQCEGGCILGKKARPWPSATSNGLWPTTSASAANLDCLRMLPQLARAWPLSAAGQPGFQPPATSSKRVIAFASSRLCTNLAAYSSMAFRSFACPSPS